MHLHNRTYQKASAINMDGLSYGTIAEIGAGQETSRWFFLVGGAAGTIAKSMSAYDMKFSDSIYGECKRYVSRERLNAMLDKEYDLLLERLDEQRGEGSRFFAFANTVATISFTQQKAGHGWLGIRFQMSPREAPSQIDIHVSLKGKTATEDQETLGVLGVNLVYGALFLQDDLDVLLDSLMDSIDPDMLDIDMIDLLGPAFEQVDNRLMALQLVRKGMTQAALFGPDGKLKHAADALYKRAVLVERSRFRPPTLFNMDLLDCATNAFCAQTDVDRDEVMVISEMTLQNLTDGDDIDASDFLQRVDILCSLGKNVLVSNYGEYYKLAQYLFRLTNRPIAIAMGLPSLRSLFEEHYYEHLDGGILEAFGRMFRNDLRLYVCPSINEDGTVVTADEFAVSDHLQHLYRFLKENDQIQNLDTVCSDYLSIHADEVLRKIRCGETDWQQQVPEQVVGMILERGLFKEKDH